MNLHRLTHYTYITLIALTTFLAALNLPNSHA